MANARIFRSGKHQAVRLPKEIHVHGDEVEIFRRGDEIVIREKTKGMARAFDLIAGLPPIKRSDRPPQRRKGL